MKAQINYHGFIANEYGVHGYPEEGRVIQELVPPTDRGGVRAFVGMGSYCRRFSGFSEIASPLIALTKEHAQIRGDKESRNAFQTSTNALIKIPVLAFDISVSPLFLH